MLIYRKILKARARRRLSAPPAAAPTVCVGNVTVGGTGKTPHTELIMTLLRSSERWGGCRLAMLSRGYKRSSRGYQRVETSSSASFAGDEPLQVKKKFPEVDVSVDKNRVRGCAELIAAGAQIIVLDDAFQYNRLKPSLDIVLVDCSRPVFSDSLLPFGRLRDLPERIFEADIIIVTKCPRGMDDAEKAAFASELRLSDYGACKAKTPSGKEVGLLFSHIEYCPLQAVFPEADTHYIYAHNALVFSGIANDGPLKAYLSDNYRLISSISFPDHHKFSRADINQIEAAAERYPTAAIITTEKDAARIADAGNLSDKLRSRLFVLPIKVAFESHEEETALREALERL